MICRMEKIFVFDVMINILRIHWLTTFWRPMQLWQGMEGWDFLAHPVPPRVVKEMVVSLENCILPVKF